MAPEITPCSSGTFAATARHVAAVRCAQPRSLTPLPQNYAMLAGHKNAVLEVQWMAQHGRLLSCSADKVRCRSLAAFPPSLSPLAAQTVRAWDAETGQPVKKLAEHSAVVNSVCPARKGPPLLVSGSDDGSVRVWDLRARKSVHRLVSENAFAVTAVAFGEGQETVYSGGLDNELRAWDLRTGEVSMALEGHTDTVTGVALSPDGSFLLSNAMDGTLRVWDVRPFAPPERCVKVMTGHSHNFEKNLLRCAWSPNGKQVSAGSADRNTYIWAVETASLEYKLPGHKGSVNEVDFHPSEPIVGSASSDSSIFLGELAS